MWRPTIEFVFGLSLGFIYAYLNAYLLSDTTISRRSTRCICPQPDELAHKAFTLREGERNLHTQIGAEQTRLQEERSHFLTTTTTNIAESNTNTSSIKNIRLLCWIMTSPENLEKRSKYVQMTWAPRCDKHLFISSETNDTFPTVGIYTSEGRKHLTEKTMQGFEYVYKHHFNDADWFLKADDDAYVIVENLKYFLSSQNTEDPIYFGHHFKVIVEQGYFSGGSGFVVSKEALRRFGQTGSDSNYCRNQHGVAGDANFGRCMQNLGVKIGNSTDKYGRNRFHCFDPEMHLRGNYPAWYYTYDANGARSGTESMSKYAISFHYVAKQFLTIHNLLYHMKPYGLEADDPEDINQDHT
ncbi:glycoprotein-N-acetylgalactosamine 3-beta-galactosyltransferase 1-like isoform X2 [Mercenaria mercenaria]|nr:glycoprotein-N-acetylgalactosamine 3-beta-galactosyltransferase 1-like isoform X2 [Mercenaria mercenaria]